MNNDKKNDKAVEDMPAKESVKQTKISEIREAYKGKVSKAYGDLVAAIATKEGVEKEIKSLQAAEQADINKMESIFKEIG